MPKNTVLQERNSKFKALNSFSQGSSPLHLRDCCCLPKLSGLGIFQKKLGKEEDNTSCMKKCKRPEENYLSTELCKTKIIFFSQQTYYF